MQNLTNLYLLSFNRLYLASLPLYLLTMASEDISTGNTQIDKFLVLLKSQQKGAAAALVEEVCFVLLALSHFVILPFNGHSYSCFFV